MANTVTQRTVFGGGSERKIIRTIHIVSDGTEETDLVVYDNSAFIANTAKGNLQRVTASGSDCVCRLEWDQTTDVAVAVLNPANEQVADYTKFGGLKNPGGTGATGDLVLTTSGLDASDEVFLVIEITQN